MKPVIRFACLATLPLALVACQGEKKAHQGTAEGEILPGSVSDAMLPYDTVQSQPPLAPPPSASSKPGTKTGGAEKEEGAGPDDAGTPSAAPAAPTTEPAAP